MKPKLLLHSCCAVCSSHVISVLTEEYEVTVFYYNPNIWPEEEYLHRKAEQIRLLQEADFCKDVSFVDLDYDHNEYLSVITGLESEKEGGKRCEVCFRQRLEKTALYAKEHGFPFYCTTLTASPHKNSTVINALGEEISKRYGIIWLHSDFKKKDGYLHSVRLAQKYDLYRQDFCGCEFAWRGKNSQSLN